MPVSLESVLKHDRRVVASALLVVIVASWGYLLAGAGMGASALEMTHMTSGEHAAMEMGPDLMRIAAWSSGYVVLMLLMWWIMMIAMMLPSAAPTILLAAALNRRANAGGAPYGAAAFFTAGYLLAWAFFSVIAVAAQWELQQYGVLSGMLRASSPLLAGGMLIAAALWQVTPLKQACLAHCRSPVRFLTERRRDGNIGALAMGAEHGAYCLGCCWMLMLLLFVGGVMNLYWIIGLAVLVFIEKVTPIGQRASPLIAAGLGAWGLALIFGAV